MVKNFKKSTLCNLFFLGKGLVWAFLFITTLATAQQEASVWYFGLNAGIKFDTAGNVTALTDGQLSTFEGCTSIADSSGSLLFYTDGTTLYNKNHVVMPNGNGLMGDFSSTQSATIVPKPGSTNLYYIFTLDAFAGVNGFRYSIVDINLDGGNGDVIPSDKNILLYTPTNEKLAIVKHTNNTDFWVVTHGWNNNTFYSHLLTTSGVNSTPIISNVGVVTNGNTDNTWGYMKIAPNGSKIAICNSSIDAELLDFDNTTGLVTNPIILNPLIAATSFNYGVEFSPDSKKLYISVFNFDPAPRQIFQYDLTATNIVSSAQIIFSSNTIFPMALQLAPNNKIYISQYGSDKLGVINNPNGLGIACNIQMDAVDLFGRQCQLGLPPFITSFFNSAFTAQNLCLGSSTNFSLNSSQPITSILWDFGDATTSTATAPNHTYASSGTYTVTVTATTTAGVQPPASKSITISAVPIVATAVANQTVCGSASSLYNLTSHSATLFGSQSTATYGVAYFANATDLNNHANALATAYALPMGATTIYAKVYNLGNTTCYAQSSFIITKYRQPIANTITDMVVCQTPYTGTHQFDLSTKNTEVLGSQSAADFTISYHPTQTDANNNTATLPTLYTNTLPTETIYARIENNLHTACYDTKSFQIKVVSQPTISTVTPYKICDDASNDGFANFDLSNKTNEVLNGQSSATFIVKYFYDSVNANADTNPIIAPINSGNTTVYYSITAVGNNSCRVVSSFNLVVNPLPKANSCPAIYMCDIGNDGFETFNLASQNIAILNGQNPANFTVSYHLNPTDANSNSNPLASSYPNTSNPQTIYARITNTANTTCFDTTNFVIGLYKMPVANAVNNIETCDDVARDGKEIFNLGSQTTTILGTQNPADFTVSYHATQPEANTGSNPLPTNYQNTTLWQQSIFVRIQNNLSNSCFDASKKFDIIVKQKPQIVMDDEYSICENSNKIITAPAGFSSYNWYRGTTLLGTLTTHNFTVAGNYSLKVTKNYGTIICEDTMNFTIFNSNKAKIVKIDIDDWTENQNSIEVHVTGDGLYEYSLDNLNYQDSQIFTGLGTGQYRVFVNDKGKCGFVFDDVFLLTYPKYFSPNNDGANDYWNINFGETEPHLTIKIFDRYGSLVKTLQKNQVWNGLNQDNSQVVSDDYWFVVIRENGKEYKGHFALMR